jgi:hypothetical protein
MKNTDECCPLCDMMYESEGIIEAVPIDLIAAAGTDLPAPDEMDDAQLSGKLQEMIDGLTFLRIALSSTDHLSDRELYTLLWSEVLREPMEVAPGSTTGAVGLDIIGGFSEDDIETYLTYYADDETRAMWSRDFEEMEIPPKKPLPWDRDRTLPTIESMLLGGTGDQ